MSKVSMTIGGLIALVKTKDNKRAAAAMVSHGGGGHKPLLLVPTAKVTPDPAAARRLVNPVPLLTGAALGVDLSEYSAFDLTQVNVRFAGSPSASAFASNTDELAGGCPESGWESLNWLLVLNRAHQVDRFDMAPGSLDATAEITSTTTLDPGTLTGFRPVEAMTRLPKFRYRSQPRRAYTDAFRWEADYRGDVVIEFRPRGGSSVIEKVTVDGSLDGFLLHLPTVFSTPGSHATAFGLLPFEGPTRPVVSKAEKDGVCGDGSAAREEPTAGGSEVTVTVTTNAAAARVSMNITVDMAGTTAPDHEHQEDAHDHGGEQLRPLGDSFCMSCMVIANDF